MIAASAFGARLAGRFQSPSAASPASATEIAVHPVAYAEAESPLLPLFSAAVAGPADLAVSGIRGEASGRVARRRLVRLRPEGHASSQPVAGESGRGTGVH